MALIKCPECGKEISSMAPACPNCGYSFQLAKASIQIPVTISRVKSLYGSPIKGNVYIDDRLIGELKNGDTLKSMVGIGRHSVSTETNVRHGDPFMALSTSVATSGTEFEVTERTREVCVEVGFKGSFTGTTGKLVVRDIKCK